MAQVRTRQTGKLREFSTQLAERLKAATATAATDTTRLAVRVGPSGYLVDMNAAAEIVAVPPITPVPWTKPWYRGLANVRGRLVGVVDLMQFSGRAPLGADQSQQLLVFGESLNLNAGILVSRAFGLRNIKELEAVQGPAEDGRPWEAARYRDLDGSVLTELDLGKLVSSEVFSSIGV
jgi:twitching motility protein PilI